MDAVELVGAAMTIMSSLCGAQAAPTPFVLELLFEQAQHQRYSGMFDAARAQHQTILTMRLQLLDEEHVDRAESLLALAQCSLLQSKFDDSKQFLTEAQTIRSKAFGEQHWKTGEVLVTYAEILHARSHYAESTELLSKAVGIFKSQFGDNDLHPQTSVALLCMSANARELGSYELAAALATQALNARTVILGDEMHPDVAQCLFQLALVQRAQGKVLAAKKSLDVCIAVQRERLGA